MYPTYMYPSGVVTALLSIFGSGGYEEFGVGVGVGPPSTVVGSILLVACFVMYSMPLFVALILMEALTLVGKRLIDVYAECCYVARLADRRRREEEEETGSSWERKKQIEGAVVTSSYRCSRPTTNGTPPHRRVTAPKNATESSGIGRTPAEELDATVETEPEPVCPVCLVEFKEGDSVSRSRHCIHMFHRSCMHAWLHKHDNCPLCRQDVFASSGKEVQDGVPLGPNVGAARTA